MAETENRLRSAGTHEGWQLPAFVKPDPGDQRPIWWVANTSRQPWPLDTIEPISFKEVRVDRTD